MLKRALFFAVVLATPTLASATTINVDDFESVSLGSAPSSSIWTAGTGVVVADPVVGGNQVVHFTGLGSGGDIWTLATFGPGWLVFDYYGTTGSAGLTGQTDSGGFIGLDTDQAYAGTETWVGGTGPTGGPLHVLSDNVGWRHYAYAFTVPGGGPSAYVKLEDWYHSDSVAGDAYFDNIKWTNEDPNSTSPVPEPATIGLLATGLGALVARRRRA
jgi:hypothetical protein